MTPQTNDILLNNFQMIENQPSATYYLDTEKNIIIGKCDGFEAMKQAIYCILNTERFDYLIYSWNFGIETKELIGENSSYVIPELKRVIEEALLQDNRIQEVTNFEITKEKNKIIAQFHVITTEGNIEAKKVVSI